MYTPSPFVTLVTVAGRSALHDHRNGALHEMNDTALGLWRGFAEGLGRDELTRELAEAGLSARDAGRFVDLALAGWFEAGFLVPDAVLRRLEGPADSDRNICFADIGVGLRIYGAEAAAATDALFGRLYDDQPSREHHLAVVQAEEGLFVFADGEIAGLRALDTFIPWIKARITEHYLRRVKGFLAHGALLEHSGKRLFITGKPHAGKSTLTTALGLAGFKCLGDDIVEVRPGPVFVAAPFPMTLKSGSWEMVEALGAKISDVPAYTRGDGLTVRYCWLNEIAPPGPLDVFVQLDRQKRGKPELVPMAPMQALCVILDCAASSDGHIEPDMLTGIAGVLERARAYTLTYSDLPSAVRLLERTMVGRD